MIASERSAEVNALEEVVDFDGSGGGEGEGSFGAFASQPETVESTRVRGDTFAILLLEHPGEVIYEPVVEIFATQSVACDGDDLDDPFLNGQDSDVESPSTEVKEEDISPTNCVVVQGVGDCGSAGVAGGVEDVQTADCPGLLGGLTLEAVGAREDDNNGIGDGCLEVGLSGVSQFGQDHGGDILW